MQGTRTQPEETQLIDHLAFVRERWLTILAIFLGFLLVSSAITVRQPAVYQAKARVLVGPGLSSSLISERSSTIEGYFLELRSFDTQLEVMRSEPVLERAARILGRLDDSASEDEHNAVLASIKGAVIIARVRDTRIVSLKALAGVPAEARDLADAMAQAYIEYSNEQRDRSRRQSIAWLTSETSNLREKLRASEERLVEYLSNEQLGSSAPDVGAASSRANEALDREIGEAELALSQLRQRYRIGIPRSPRLARVWQACTRRPKMSGSAAPARTTRSSSTRSSSGMRSSTTSSIRSCSRS